MRLFRLVVRWQESIQMERRYANDQTQLTVMSMMGTRVTGGPRELTFANRQHRPLTQPLTPHQGKIGPNLRRDQTER
jgi:hypothetical protein